MALIPDTKGRFIFINHENKTYEASIEDGNDIKIESCYQDQGMNITPESVDTLHVDSRHVYIHQNNSLFVYPHSVPSNHFTQPSFTFTLPDPIIVSITSLPALGFLTVRSSSPASSVTLYTKLNPVYSDLKCEAYPKPNVYQLQLTAYIKSCADVLRSKHIFADN
jgi:hypothetical protein